MIKKLIALDLDGTLLNNSGEISEFSKAILQQVAAKGHHIILTTGRPYRMALPHYARLDMTGPMITFNGSLTNIPGKTWTFEHERLLPQEVFHDVMIHETDWQADFIAAEYRNQFYITHTHRHTIDPKLFDVTHIEDSSAFILEKATKSPNALLLQTRHADKYQLAEQLEQRYAGNISVNTWGGPLNILECAAYGVNKAYALKELLKNLGMERSQLIAFGDEMNDEEMLSFAHIGYAMKNANKDLLGFADRQTKSTNDEDGVAKTLQELFL